MNEPPVTSRSFACGRETSIPHTYASGGPQNNAFQAPADAGSRRLWNWPRLLRPCVPHHSPKALQRTRGRTTPGPPVKGCGTRRDSGMMRGGDRSICFGILVRSRLWHSPSPDVQVRERTCGRKKGAHRPQRRVCFILVHPPPD